MLAVLLIAPGAGLGPRGNSSWAQSPAEAFDSIPTERASHLVDTLPLVFSEDIASALVNGVDGFLLQQLNASVVERQARWDRLHRESLDANALTASRDDYSRATASQREVYRRMIGAFDSRIKNTDWVIESTLVRTADEASSTDWELGTELASDPGVKIHRVRWPVFEGLDGVGLLLIPESIRFVAILIPDADQMPEHLCGVGENANTMAVELARAGGVVVVPQVVSRRREARQGRAILTDQEYLYRSGFVLGRHLLGTHVQQCMAAVDILKSHWSDRPILVGGWGEGGWVALSLGACDTRVDTTLVSGHFGPRENTWKEPIHRNVHGLLTHFGDAGLAALVAPRALMVESIPGPQVTIAGDGGAPGTLSGPDPAEVRVEFERLHSILKPWGLESSSQHIEPSALDPATQASPDAHRIIPGRIQPSTMIAGLSAMGVSANWTVPVVRMASEHWERLPTPDARRLATLTQIDRYQQTLLDRIHLDRERYWKDLDATSLERFRATIEPYRQEFSEEIIGRWNMPKTAPAPRTRMVYDREKWRGYEVVLDVFEGVIAYGVLLIPKSDQPIVHRPCIVFQHGLEGRPTDTIVGDHPAYHDVAARLVEEGYVVFAPQNLYLFQDRFRTLQRKSNLLGKTLFSTIISQHEQLVHWLSSRPEIDPDRIAFYGLSYGGKSAMRIPALVPEYCLSICSADFNDWVWKNASTTSPYSYVWTMEYEIFEFDLGPKFNYAEMATLIAPRPFMVERGHFDGVAPDERVGLEYAKVRRLYSAKLGIPERTAIEWFPGPHTIHGVGTFDFLRRHLNWNERDRIKP